MNKYNYFVFTLLIFLLLFFMSSCGDTKEVNEKDILTTALLDKKDDEIYFYIEIANTESKNNNNADGGSGGNKYTYIIGQGKTIPEARYSLDNKMNKQLYLSAARMLILTEDFSKENLVEYFYRLRADESYRKKVMTVITKEDPKNLFEALNEKNESVGFSIDELLNSLDDQRKTFLRTTSRILENLSSKYTGILIPCIGLQEKEIALIGYSVINGTKVDGFIPIQESKGVVYLKADEPKFTYIVSCNDVEFTIQVELKKRKIKPTLKNNEINFDVQLEFDAKLMYGNQKIPYNFGEEENKAVTELLTEMLKKEITEAIDKSQNEFKCDYFSFDDEFRMKYPEKFEELDWASEYLKAEIKNDVKVSLDTAWMMNYGSYKIR